MPKKRYPFMLMLKGESEEQWSQGEHDFWSINVFISVAINVDVSINAKGGDYCTISLENLFSLMSTLGY
jgi:hypothetical protein